jgi:hypothetical protein
MADEQFEQLEGAWVQLNRLSVRPQALGGCPTCAGQSYAFAFVYQGGKEVVIDR